MTFSFVSSGGQKSKIKVLSGLILWLGGRDLPGPVLLAIAGHLCVQRHLLHVSSHSPFVLGHQLS